jgi:hypothetical protein
MRSFFDQVQAALAGTARLPLDGGSTKLLYFMLERNHGCDVTMTRGIRSRSSTAGTSRITGTITTSRRAW